MLRYIIRRTLMGLVTLLGICVVTFFVIELAPGDPAAMKARATENPRVSERIYKQLRAYYGLDQPVYVQFGKWMYRLARGDLGNSFHDGRKVSGKIREALWPTISVELISLVLAFALSLPIGIWSAYRQGGPFDRIVSTFLYMLYSVPSYVMGMILILYLGVRYNLLPFRGMHSDNYAQLSAWGQLADSARHFFMITFCYTFGSLAFYSRFVRQNLIEVIRQDYIRTARAKGLGEGKVVLQHAFRNSLIPFVTLLGLTFPAILSGSVILETMFNWPGLGRLYYESLLMRDYPTLMALNFITAFLVLLGTFLADLAYGLVDPRITYD
ncbi:MAG: ABC transporter permease [bacterium]|nr:ABC transporter permease [bacterium]